MLDPKRLLTRTAGRAADEANREIIKGASQQSVKTEENGTPWYEYQGKIILSFLASTLYIETWGLMVPLVVATQR